MKLSIILPAYNEAERLPETLQKIFKHMEDFQGEYEVLVANDGSKDDTAEAVNQLTSKYPELRLLDYKVNRGRGEVCKAAVKEAVGDYILITDADGSTDEKFIIPFDKYLDEHPEIDMLTGSRDVKGAIIHTPQPPFRVLLNKVFLLMAKILFGWPMHDRVNGFKMGRKSMMQDIYKYQIENTFFAEAELIYIADRRGYKVVELPIEWTDDRDSRVQPLKEAWNSFFGMFKIVVRGKKGVYTKNKPN